MKWEEIDFNRQVWETPDGKNNLPQRMILCTQAIDLLTNRKSNNTEDSPFVFPSKSEKGHLVEPKKGWQRILRNSGIDRNITIHDLRRTFASFMRDIGADEMMIKKALNHTNKDVTAIYARGGENVLKDNIQKAADRIYGKIK